MVLKIEVNTMADKLTRYIAAIICCYIVLPFTVTGCCNLVPSNETSSTLYSEADLMTMYDIIHKAIPILDTQYEYTCELNEPAMYINLYVYNTERVEADQNFEELTIDEIKEYLSNGEITLDYLNENWELPYSEKCEYGMSDRVRDYFEWFWGEGAYITEDYDSNSGTKKLEEYRISLQSTLTDLHELYPNMISVDALAQLSVEQTRILIEYNDHPEAIQGDDLDLFM